MKVDLTRNTSKVHVLHVTYGRKNGDNELADCVDNHLADSTSSKKLKHYKVQYLLHTSYLVDLNLTESFTNTVIYIYIFMIIFILAVF